MSGLRRQRHDRPPRLAKCPLARVPRPPRSGRPGAQRWLAPRFAETKHHLTHGSRRSPRPSDDDAFFLHFKASQPIQRSVASGNDDEARQAARMVATAAPEKPAQDRPHARDLRKSKRGNPPSAQRSTSPRSDEGLKRRREIPNKRTSSTSGSSGTPIRRADASRGAARMPLARISIAHPCRCSKRARWSLFVQPAVRLSGHLVRRPRAAMFRDDLAENRRRSGAPGRPPRRAASTPGRR